jgi:hypothetical protein
MADEQAIHGCWRCGKQGRREERVLIRNPQHGPVWIIVCADCIGFYVDVEELLRVTEAKRSASVTGRSVPLHQQLPIQGLDQEARLSRVEARMERLKPPFPPDLDDLRYRVEALEQRDAACQASRHNLWNSCNERFRKIEDRLTRRWVVVGGELKETTE